MSGINYTGHSLGLCWWGEDGITIPLINQLNKKKRKQWFGRKRPDRHGLTGIKFVARQLGYRLFNTLSSNSSDTDNKSRSENLFPMSCRPTGRPLALESPAGKLMEGRSARFAGIRK